MQALSYSLKTRRAEFHGHARGFLLYSTVYMRDRIGPWISLTCQAAGSEGWWMRFKDPECTIRNGLVAIERQPPFQAAYIYTG